MKRKKLKKFYSRIISFLFKQFINNIKNIPIENAFITSLRLTHIEQNDRCRLVRIFASSSPFVSKPAIRS